MELPSGKVNSSHSITRGDEQEMLFCVALIYPTEPFDLVSREDLSKVQKRSKLQSTVEFFLTDINGTVQFNGSSSEPIEIRSGVKQDCVLDLLFVLSFALMLKHAFDTATEGTYLRIRCSTSPASEAQSQEQV